MQTPIRTVMKRFVLLLLLILFFGAEVSWSSSCGDHQFIPIRVLDNTTETGREHRSQEYVPIEAYYDAFTSYLCLTFFQDLGEVEIYITNLNNGYYYECDFNTSIGVIMLPLCGDCGIYHITLIPSCGGGYEGEFEIE